MTDPPGHEGYTWPVAPAGSRPPRQRRPSQRPGEAGTMLKRPQGLVAGAAATAFPALRSFAGGFLVASVVGGFAAFIALVVFFVVVFANMGP